jgi:hypothetical protein
LEFANFAVSTLATGIDDTVGTLDVASGHGARFPAADFWIAVADAPDPGGTGEVMLCTSRSTDTLTVTRGQDDTAGVAHSAGEVVQLVAPATFYRNEPFATFPGLKPPDTAHADDEEWLVDTTSPPTGWAWANQGSATLQAGKRRLAMAVPASSTRVNRGLMRAAPAGDFSVATLLYPSFRNETTGLTQDLSVALLWGTVATPTRIDNIRMTSNVNGNTAMSATTFSDYTTATATHAVLLLWNAVDPTWVRISWDATAETVAFQFTVDPAAELWETVASGIAGPGAGADPAFFGPLASEDANIARVAAWGPVRVNWTPDYTPA